MNKKQTLAAGLISAFLITTALSVKWLNLRLSDIEQLKESASKNAAYVRRFANQNPGINSAINRYLDCTEKKVNAIEGCLNYAGKTSEEKQKIQELDTYLQADYIRVAKLLKTVQFDEALKAVQPEESSEEIRDK